MSLLDLEADVMVGAHNTYTNSVREGLRGKPREYLQGIVTRHEAKPLLRRLFGSGGKEYVEAKFLLSVRSPTRY